MLHCTYVCTYIDRRYRRIIKREARILMLISVIILSELFTATRSMQLMTFTIFIS